MDIASRLDIAMKAAGIVSQSALARASGVPQPTINRILKAVGKRGPESHTIVQLARACNVSFEWLHEGKGSMTRTSDVESASLAGGQRQVKIADDDNVSEFVRVPMLETRLHAGTPGFGGDAEYDDGVRATLSRHWVEEKRLSADQLFAMKVTGDSMYPTLKAGNVVIINKADCSPLDGELFAVNHHGKALVKRLERDVGVWYLVSDNSLPEFRKRPVLDEHTTVVGRVVKMERDFI